MQTEIFYKKILEDPSFLGSPDFKDELKSKLIDSYLSAEDFDFREMVGVLSKGYYIFFRNHNYVESGLMEAAEKIDLVAKDADLEAMTHGEIQKAYRKSLTLFCETPNLN